MHQHPLADPVLKMWLHDRADSGISINQNLLMDAAFNLVISCDHVYNSLRKRVSTFVKQFLDHGRVDLLPDNLWNLVVVEKCHFPLFVVETFWEVFKVSGFHSLDALDCQQLALLLWNVVSKHFCQHHPHCGVAYLERVQVRSVEIVFVICDIHKEDDQVF